MKYPQWVGGRRKINAKRKARAAARLDQVWAAYAAGESQASIARRFGLHRSSICRQLKAADEAGYEWDQLNKRLAHMAATDLVRGLFNTLLVEHLRGRTKLVR